MTRRTFVGHPSLMACAAFALCAVLFPSVSRGFAVQGLQVRTDGAGAYGSSVPAGNRLYYHRLRNRWYSPELMQFLSKDPAGVLGGWNLYAYANGNPISRRDPRGLVGDVVDDWRPGYYGSGTQLDRMINGGNGTTPLSPADVRPALQAMGAEAAILGGSLLLPVLPAVYTASGQYAGTILGAFAPSLFGLLTGVEIAGPPLAAAAVGGARCYMTGTGGGGAASGGGEVALDTMVLIKGVAPQGSVNIGQILNGRTPVVSITAVKQFLSRSDPAESAVRSFLLRQFLTENGGRIGLPATGQILSTLQALDLPDARVAGSAIREGIPLITEDQDILRVMTQQGYPVIKFP